MRRRAIRRPLAWLACALAAACGGDDAAPPAAPVYEDALAVLERGLESRVPPIEVPALPPETAATIAELLDALGSTGSVRLARGARDEILTHGESAVGPILDFARDRARDARARRAAADLLGEFPGSIAAADASARIASDGDDETVRAAAARAAGRIGARFVVPALLFRLKDESSDLAALHLAGALARLGNLAGVSAVLVVIDRQTVADTLPVGAEIARLAGETLPEDASAEGVRDALVRANERWTREGVPPGGSPAPDDRTSLAFARWASRLGGNDLRPVDDARFVFSRAGREGIDALLVALRDRNAFARVRAMEVLGWLGPVARDAVEPLVRLASDPAHRAEPLVALGRIGDRRATPLLLDALDARNLDLRVAAARGLAAIEDPAASAALRRLLDANRPGRAGASPDLALFAAEGLARLGDLDALATLVSLGESGGPVDPAAFDQALEAAFAKFRARGLDDGGVGAAATPEERRAAARAWADARSPR